MIKTTLIASFIAIASQAESHSESNDACYNTAKTFVQMWGTYWLETADYQESPYENLFEYRGGFEEQKNCGEKNYQFSCSNLPEDSYWVDNTGKFVLDIASLTYIPRGSFCRIDSNF